MQLLQFVGVPAVVIVIVCEVVAYHRRRQAGLTMSQGWLASHQ
jgi:hypothetical protein